MITNAVITGCNNRIHHVLELNKENPNKIMFPIVNFTF